MARAKLFAIDKGEVMCHKCFHLFPHAEMIIEEARVRRIYCRGCARKLGIEGGVAERSKALPC